MDRAVNRQTMSSRSEVRRGFIVDAGCPACGGHLSLDDDFAIVICEHCSSVLRILTPQGPPVYIIEPKVRQLHVRFQVDHYLRENGQPPTPSSIEVSGFYHPYWRIDSLLLRLRNVSESRIVVSEEGNTETYREETEERQNILLTPHSSTLDAVQSDPAIPYSLGMRADYVKLVPFTSDQEDEELEIVEPHISIEAAFKQSEMGVRKIGDSVNQTLKKNYSRLFGIRGSLVYFPYYQCICTRNSQETRYIVDAVSKRVVGESTTEPIAPTSPEVTVPTGTIRLELHRCGNCGTDYPPVRSLLNLCTNCQSLTMLESHPAFVGPVLWGRTNDTNGSDSQIPFWLLEFDGTIKSGSNLLAIPAFRIHNFEALCRITDRVSGGIDKFDLSGEPIYDGEHIPVNVTVAEAAILAHGVYARKSLERTGKAQTSPDFQVRRAQLAMLPFHRDSYFYVDSVISAITVEERAILR